MWLRKSNIYTNAFLFYLLTGAAWYYHAIYIVLTFLETFTGYEDYVLKGNSNLCVQRSKFGWEIYKFCRNDPKSSTLYSLWSFFLLTSLHWTFHSRSKYLSSHNSIMVRKKSKLLAFFQTKFSTFCDMVTDNYVIFSKVIIFNHTGTLDLHM